jgi:hypothetical protein
MQNMFQKLQTPDEIIKIAQSNNKCSIIQG